MSKIAEAFNDKNIDAVAGKTVYFTKNNFEEPIQQSKLSAKGLMMWDKGVKFVQPGVWLRKDKIIACRGIDEQFNYAFDWDMYIRYFYKFDKIKYINEILVYFRLHQTSKTSSELTKFHKEEEKIIKKLIKQPELSKLYYHGNFRLNRAEWYSLLENITKENTFKIKKILKILIKTVSLPRVRFNRITFGAIKNIIFNKNT